MHWLVNSNIVSQRTKRFQTHPDTTFSTSCQAQASLHSSLFGTALFPETPWEHCLLRLEILNLPSEVLPSNIFWLWLGKKQNKANF